MQELPLLASGEACISCQAAYPAYILFRVFSLQAAGLQRPHVRREITEYASGKKSSAVMAEFESWAAFNMALKQFHSLELISLT